MCLSCAGACIPAGEPFVCRILAVDFHPLSLSVYINIYICVCVHVRCLEPEKKAASVSLRSGCKPCVEHKSFKTSVLFLLSSLTTALFSLTTTTAAIAALAHLSQRAHEEDSGPTHICFRSKAICCKCAREVGMQ